MNSVLIGTHQMDTEFGLYLPEYSIPAPVPQTKFINVIGRDGAVDLSNAFGSVHYNSREWNLDFKHFDPVNWHTISSSVFNAIHGKRLDFTFDDDPNYHWTGRFIVQDYTSKNGCGTLKVRVMADPFKYKNTQTTVSSSVPVNEQTLTGDIVTINNNKAYEVNSLWVSLSPIQDLHGYSSPWPAGGGKNKLKIKDKNSSGITGSYNSAGEYVIIGTTGSATTYCDFQPVTLPAGSYTFSISTLPNGFSSSYNKNGSWAGFVTDGKTITLTEETEIGGYIFMPANTEVNTTIKIQLESGSSASSFAPYSNICPISGRTGVSVYRTGKNLLDTSSFTSGTYNDVTLTRNTDGSIALIGTASATFNLNGSTFTLPAGTYTLSGSIENNQLYLRDSSTNTNLVESVNGNVNNFTISESKTVYLRIRVGGSSTVSGTVKPQLELGSTATAYEPYNGNTYSVDWTSEAGTVYGGTLDVVTGVLTVTHGVVTYDGTENWGWLSNIGSAYLTLSGLKPSDASTQFNVLCTSDKLQGISWTSKAGHTEAIFSYYGGSYICIKDQAITDAASAKTWLQSNSLQVVYELATPLTYQLTAQEVELLTGTNNIWSEGQVSVVITEPIVINNPTLPVVPTVTASAPMTLRWNAQSYSMDAGTRVIPQLTLQTGNNPIYVDGEGTISFAFSEASL